MSESYRLSEAYKLGSSTAEELRDRMKDSALSEALRAAQDHRATVEKAQQEFEGGSDETIKYWCKLIIAKGDVLDARLKACMSYGWTPQAVASQLRAWLSPVYIEDLLGPRAGGF